MKISRLFTIFLIVFIDLLGFGLILPLLPFYADTYGASPITVGLLTASYAAAQLVGAPVLGRLSDRYGRRPILLISIFGTAVGFLLLGVADPLGSWISGQIPANWIGEDTQALRNGLILALLFLTTKLPNPEILIFSPRSKVSFMRSKIVSTTSTASFLEKPTFSYTLLTISTFVIAKPPLVMGLPPNQK